MLGLISSAYPTAFLYRYEITTMAIAPLVKPLLSSCFLPTAISQFSTKFSTYPTMGFLTVHISRAEWQSITIPYRPIANWWLKNILVDVYHDTQDSSIISYNLYGWLYEDPILFILLRYLSQVFWNVEKVQLLCRWKLFHFDQGVFKLM